MCASDVSINIPTLLQNKNKSSNSIIAMQGSVSPYFNGDFQIFLSHSLPLRSIADGTVKHEELFFSPFLLSKSSFMRFFSSVSCAHSLIYLNSFFTITICFQIYLINFFKRENYFYYYFFNEFQYKM